MTPADKPNRRAVIDPCPFPEKNGQMMIGGIPLDRLAARVGRTPFYAYDRSVLEAHVRALRAVIPSSISLHYAMKANPMPALVQTMVPLVDGLDLASGGELGVALNAGARPETMSFAGPGKRPEELHQAVAAGVTINIESSSELPTIVSAGELLGVRPRVAVRVNPDFELKASGMKMSGGPKQFGVDAEVVPALLRGLAKEAVEFMGFHVYSGSQNLQPEAICDAQNKTFDLALRLAEHAPGPIRLLNMGGGFGVPYFPNDRPLDLDPIVANLASIGERASSVMPDAELVIELGRYLVAHAGVYVTRVIDRKVSRGQTFLVTDGGLHHHLAASGNFGQVIRKNYPIVVGNRMRGEQEEPVSIVGPLCTPLDILGDRVALPRAEVGDFICVLMSGAYGFTASPHLFLSHPAPLEVLV
ncbi:MAG: pyridoxal-dependent decarboxylase, exosortase A system-associated [Betaproteobacteria bacterium]|nr:pyridoxal-dependent decarboxylase, exosortase A system-associated [Betaproteobacteria bacterium]